MRTCRHRVVAGFAKGVSASYGSALFQAGREQVVTDIFSEVDEDLRKDKFLDLWKRHGNYVIALGVAIIVGTVGYVVYQRYTESHRLQRAQEFVTAAEQIGQGDNSAAVGAFATVAQSDDGYGILAKFRMANLKNRAGDDPGAVAIYDSIAANSGIPTTFRDLATILAAMHSLDKADPAALTQRLQPLTADGSPWRYSALELTGLLAHRANDDARAKEIFAKLADDREAPQAIRARAAEVLASLRG
jgi:hypothetical protein